VQISASKAFAKKKKFTLFRSFREYFRHAENYFRHCQKLHTSQQQQQPIQYAHARDFTIAAAGRAFGPDRAVPGINSVRLLRCYQRPTANKACEINITEIKVKFELHKIWLRKL